MRYDFSMGRGGVIAVAAGLAAAGVLLFFAGLLLGTAAATRGPALAMAADSAAAADTLPLPAAEPCPPVPAAAPSPAPAVAAEGARQPAPVAVFRDEQRALALRDRMSARGVDAVIQAEAAPDGGAVFRVVPASASTVAWGAP